MFRRGIQTVAIAALGALAAIGTTGSAARAADFPNGNVSYIIPFGPGGESDVTARYQQAEFAKLYSHELVISYKPGGGGAVAWSQLNAMPGDGSVVMGVNLPHIIVKPKQGNVGFKTDDLVPVFMFHYTPDAIIVPADSPYKTLQDLIDDAKAHPGQVTFSGSGKGTANHLANIRFDQLSGVKTTYVAFKGTGAAMTALLGRQVKAEWGYTTVGMAQGDKVRLLAVATAERAPTFPDVPTFKELGLDMVSGAYRGIAVPKSTPEALRQQISDAFAKVNETPAFRKTMIDNGYALLDVGYGKPMNDFMAKMSKLYLSEAKDAGIIK